MSTVWRVDIDYLSRDYEDRMLSVSSPYRDEAAARIAYQAALAEKCVDRQCPARVSLTRTDFPDDPYAMGVTTVVEANIKE